MLQTTRVRESFEILYREHWAETVARARKTLRGRADAADVAATAFTRLWAELQDGREDDVLARLRALTDTTAAAEEQRLRRQGERIGYVLDGGVEGAPTLTPILPGTHAEALALTMPTPTLETIEFREVFDQAVRALPPKQRDAFILTELRGLTQDEAADVLGITQPSVSERTSRARQFIANALTEGGIA